MGQPDLIVSSDLRRASRTAAALGELLDQEVSHDARLRERYGVARVIIRRKEFFSKPASEALLNEMASEVQVAAAALGG